MQLCVVEAGESIVVPHNWWHGTCGLGAWNAGFTFIGGEAAAMGAHDGAAARPARAPARPAQSIPSSGEPIHGS